jgi:HTH-type transcriptional regulator / antitoxin HigA
MEKMSAVEIPDYAELLMQMLPTKIHNDEQNEHFVAKLEELVFKDKLTEAEDELVELLTVLVEEYENRRFPIEDASPIEVLQHLMEANNLKQKDLIDVFGAESTVSSVLNGKRPMTRDHIQKLRQRFGVSADVFFSDDAEGD